MSRSGSTRDKRQSTLERHLGSASGATKEASGKLNVAAAKMAASPLFGDAGEPTPAAVVTLAMSKEEMADHMAQLATQVTAQVAAQVVAQVSAQVASQFAAWRVELARQKEELRAEMMGVMDAALQKALTPTRNEMRGVTDRLGTQAATITGMEEALSEHDNRLAVLEKEIEVLKSGACFTKGVNDRLELAVEDLICRSKRQNLRLVNIPEEVEGSDPVSFVKTMLTELAQGDPDLRLPTLVLDRAHRSLGRRRVDGPPRAFIVRFHEYLQKDLVLQWAKKKRNIEYEGFSFRIYEDFAPSLVRKRAEFNDVKALMFKDKDVRFSMQFPARLRVTFRGGSTQYFDSAEAAKTFYLRNKAG